MPSSREIKRRIRSVKNVAQITRAMEMVSASKMRRAQRNVLAARPYAERMLELMSHLAARVGAAARKGTLLEQRSSVTRVALVIVTPDRGLCGSLVANVLRRASRFILEQRERGRSVDLYTYGKKGRDYIVRSGFPLIAEATKLGDRPTLEAILGVAVDAISKYEQGTYDEVHIVYSEFVNTLIQRAATRQLLPIQLPEGGGTRVLTDYTYEPGEEEVLNALLPRYVETQVYQSILDSIASEHSARMVAMRNATSNAKDLVRALTLSFNKARQAAITKEVSEISSGAAALAE